MRSHAKASPAGSNLDRGASHRSLRRPGALAALLVALMAAACLLPGSALAIEFRSKTDSFGPDGTSGSSFTEYLGPLAFDQGSKRLYALDQEEQELHAYDLSSPGTHTEVGGNFPLAATGSGSQDDIVVDSATHDLYYGSFSGGKVYGFDETGSLLSGYPLSKASTETMQNVCGVAIDPSGKLWVSQINSYVYRFNSDGSGSFNPNSYNPYSFSGSHCRLAFDSHENLYVATPYGAVKKYTPEGEYNPSTQKVIDPVFTYAIAVDRSTNEVYVVHEESIAVYDEEGTLLYEFGEGAGNYYGELGGIAINEATGEAYVSDYGHHKIDVFGPPLALPKLATEPADDITSTGATVEGTVNPRGLAVEGCRFEVVPAQQFLQSGYENVDSEEEFPCVPAPGSIPVDSEPHAVSAAVTGLEPATIYHYRLLASNELGEAHSLDAQFTTGATAPLIKEESVETVGNIEAIVSAQINPRGAETTYHLEYGTTNAYGQSTTESSAFGFPADNSRHKVSVHIGGLQPGTAYHFRFVAANGVDTTDGADASFATYPLPTPFAPCPNDGFRTGAGGRLPDCRAYEQATPIEKHGAGAQGAFRSVGASSSGDRVTFYANGGLTASGGSGGIVPYVASRGPGGWSTDGFLPPTEPGPSAAIRGVNEDLSAALVEGNGPGGVGRQLFVRDSDTGSFQPGPVASYLGETLPAGFAAADREHLVFTSDVQLVPGAPPATVLKPNLYDLDHGALTLASRVPAGSEVSCDDETGPACEASTQGSAYPGGGARAGISADGSRVFFTVTRAGQSNGTGRIYMREDGKRTTWISASQRTTPDPNGEKPAKLAGFTPDGSQVFFLSCEKLTDDSTAASVAANSCENDFGLGEHTKGPDLYAYDVESGQLTDLTVDTHAGDPLGANVGTVYGFSDDGSYVYFFAQGVLAPGASLGQNIYVYHDGVTKLIAGISPEGEGGGNFVSADGRSFVFATTVSLTGYDNVGGENGSCGGFGSDRPCIEFFRYNAPEEKLLCLTCLPTGTPPRQPTTLGGANGGLFFPTGSASPGRPRNFSANGNRFFFDSIDPLVPGDTNGVRDVYEWEAKGEGSCQSESQNGGCIYLISGGTDPEASGFLDASKDGDHVFLFTEQQLVPSDEDSLFDVYDAGVGAGLASQHILSPPSCTSTACQANPPPPVDPSLASSAYSGAGNAHQAPKGRKCPKGTRKVRAKGKAHCQRRHNKRQHNRANANRGGSK